MIGGYGAVGQHVVDHVCQAPGGPPVLIPGRSGDRAKALAATHGERASGAALDVRDPEATRRAVAAARLVVLTTEIGTTDVARTCAAGGVSMVSVAASVGVLRRIEALEDEARSSEATLAVEVGLAAGLMNIVARNLLRACPEADRLDLVLELGFVGRDGPEAVTRSLAQAAGADGVETLDLPAPMGRLRGIPVAYLDPERAAERLGVRKMRSYLALRPAWLTAWLPALVTTLVPRTRLVHGAAGAASRLVTLLWHPGEMVRLIAYAHGTDGGTVAMIEGHDQSRITGVVAAETAIALLRGDVPVGVRGMADILSLRELENSLDRIGCRITGVGEEKRF